VKNEAPTSKTSSSGSQDQQRTKTWFSQQQLAKSVSFYLLLIIITRKRACGLDRRSARTQSRSECLDGQLYHHAQKQLLPTRLLFCVFYLHHEKHIPFKTHNACPRFILIDALLAFWVSRGRFENQCKVNRNWSCLRNFRHVENCKEAIHSSGNIGVGNCYLHSKIKLKILPSTVYVPFIYMYIFIPKYISLANREIQK
jgi:hypothetical protein